VRGPVLVLSPHLDDAALSVGGVIASLAASGTRVVVGVLFDGQPPGSLSPAARAFHAQCGHGDDAMTHRTAEDRSALRVLGAERLRASLPEALYRTAGGKVLYPSRDAIFGAVSQEDCAASLVANVLRSWVDSTGCATVLAPAGIGGHVDHVVVSSAARELSVQVALYEDLPYPMLGARRPPHLGRPSHHRVSRRSWTTKLDAVSHYRSQLPILFHDTETWRETLTEYCADSGEVGERLWWL
jgi:LmbE family N-acetylglucosaminyl deacetylase